MDAEAERTSCPVAVDQYRSPETVPSRRVTALVASPFERGAAFQLRIQHVDTHVEVFGDVPLGSCADPPGLPVMSQPAVATRADATVPTPYASAQHGIGGTVVVDLRIAAVERRPPTRAPEVLIGRVDVPSRGQLDVLAAVRRKSRRRRIAYDAEAQRCRLRSPSSSWVVWKM